MAFRLTQGRSFQQSYLSGQKVIVCARYVQRVRLFWVRPSQPSLPILSQDPLTTRVTTIFLPVGRAVVPLRLLQPVSAHWRLVHKRLALQYVPQPFVALLVSNQVLSVFP